MEYAVLNNGLKMPMEGIGTFLLQPAEAEESVYQALKAGYRFFRLCGLQKEGPDSFHGHFQSIIQNCIFHD